MWQEGYEPAPIALGVSIPTSRGRSGPIRRLLRIARRQTCDLAPSQKRKGCGGLSPWLPWSAMSACRCAICSKACGYAGPDSSEKLTLVAQQTFEKLDLDEISMSIQWGAVRCHDPVRFLHRKASQPHGRGVTHALIHLQPQKMRINMSGRAFTTFLGMLAAASVMIGAGPAQAKTAPVSYDPTSFNGVGNFFVPDPPSPCLTLGIGFHFVNPGTEGCSGVVLLDASLTAHDTGGTVDLSLPPPTPGANDVTGMVLNPSPDGNVVHLVGFNTVEIPIGETDCSGDLCGFSWFIQFDSGLPLEEYYAAADDGWALDGLNNQVFLYNQCDGCQNPTLFSTATNVQFGPEPGSVGLFLGALGAGWLARRRKRAA